MNATPPPLEAIHLRHGSHTSRDEGMCMLEAVAFFAGEKHSDSPKCVCPTLAAFGRGWNDGLENDDERDKWLKPFIPRLINTRGSAELSEHRSWMALDWLIRVQGPAWMDMTESLREHAAILRALPPQVGGGELIASKDARAAARAAAWDAAWAAAWDAAGAAAWDAARAAAGDAAWAAAGAAAWAAARDAAGAAAGAAAWAAAWAALTPTKETLKASAADLFDRMILEQEVQP